MTSVNQEQIFLALHCEHSSATPFLWMQTSYFHIIEIWECSRLENRHFYGDHSWMEAGGKKKCYFETSNTADRLQARGGGGGGG